MKHLLMNLMKCPMTGKNDYFPAQYTFLQDSLSCLGKNDVREFCCMEFGVRARTVLATLIWGWGVCLTQIIFKVGLVTHSFVTAPPAYTLPNRDANTKPFQLLFQHMFRLHCQFADTIYTLCSLLF